MDVFDATKSVDQRTNNVCEARNNSSRRLVGQNQPSVIVSAEGCQGSLDNTGHGRDSRASHKITKEGNTRSAEKS